MHKDIVAAFNKLVEIIKIYERCKGGWHYGSVGRGKTDKTSIIITYRLGSTQIADRVFVMDKGSIVGDGTHESLMTDCELYRNMYNSQAEWYLVK